VLAKRLKIEVRSHKRLGLDLGVKDLIFPGGYSQDLQDTIFRSNPYRILQGLLRKNTFFFLRPQQRTGEAGGSRGRRRRPGDPGAQLSWGKKRGGLGDFKEELTVGRGGRNQR
jgi:hypothetical protein